MLADDGLALVVHTDFDTQVYASDDLQRTRRLVHAFDDQGRRPAIGRDLAGICRAAGFASVEPSVYTLVGTSFAEGLYPRALVAMMRTWLVGDGGVDAAKFDTWVAELEARDRDGRFFFSINRNLCVCRR
jgi:hypothetical protein